MNFDGVVDEADEDDFAAAIKAFNLEAASYDPRADLDADGDVDEDDETLFLSSLAARDKEEGMWKLSGGPGLLPGHTGAEAGLDNRFGWRGYWYDRRLQEYHVRNRVYDPRPGAWMQNDPLGFDAGDQNLYRYANGNYSTGYDPEGLEPRTHQPGGTDASDFLVPGSPNGDIYRRIFWNGGHPVGTTYWSENGNRGNNFNGQPVLTAAEADLMLGQIQLMAQVHQLAVNGHIALTIAGAGSELAMRLALAPVDFVWSAGELIHNPKDPLNWLAIIPYIGKVKELVVTVKEAGQAEKILKITVQDAELLAKGEAKIVKEGDKLVVKAEGKAAEACGEALSTTTAPYGEMRGTLERGMQANHLNQDAAFKSVIPSDEGVAVALRGNAITEIGSPHYEFHASLEAFWNNYRKGGELFGARPTNGEYGQAVQAALRAAGYSEADAARVAAAAAANRTAHGLSETGLVPRIPGRMNQSRRPGTN